MKSSRSIPKVIAGILAAAAIVFLLATYGTALPTTPFASVPLNGPTAADSDGKMTAIVDTETRRALILNEEGALTGVVECTTADSPVEVITGACVSDGLVYVAGAKLVPDSDDVEKERIAVYDKGGNLQDIVYEKPGTESDRLSIKAIGNAPGGAIVAIEKSVVLSENAGKASKGDVSELANTVEFLFVSAANSDAPESIGTVKSGIWSTFSVGFSAGSGEYVLLSSRGLLDDNSRDSSHVYTDHVFTSVDIDDQGVLYACDDVTGSLCAVGRGGDVREILKGDGYGTVHENNGVVAVSDRAKNTIILCNSDGAVLQTLSTVAPSIGFSARMIFVWLSALYLLGLLAFFAIRRARRSIAEGRTENIGPMLASVAVIVVVVVAVGSLSHAAYDSSIKTRSNEIGLAADYLQRTSYQLSEPMLKSNDRNMFRTSGAELDKTFDNVLSLIQQVLPLVSAANENGIGMYFTLYGKDDQGIFYLFDSSDENVMGTSAHFAVGDNPVAQAFEGSLDSSSSVLHGRALRDATLYKLVQISAPESNETIGVLEIGSKMRSFEASLTANMAQRILALLVMVLVVYLTYSELRACGSSLFARRQLAQRNSGDALAMLTRPFTFAITVLEGVDVVMTVLITRDLLTAAGQSASSPLLALPTAMLGAGLVVGQALYGALGSRVGVRRLMVFGACAVLVCAGFTAASVVIGGFGLYCAAKFVMSVPFGLLYTLGYSLPRAAESKEVRDEAVGAVKRTDTSAAALGTVVGGYAAQTLGNAWVYAVVAVACLPIIIMALNLLPKGIRPLETAVKTPVRHALPKFVFSRNALPLALLIVFPATLAAGYSSFLFPLFSSDLGLEKAQINNIVVLGQLIVFLCIPYIEGAERRFRRWRVMMVAMALMGVVFALFSLNTTIVWSIAVVALVAVLCKSTDGWKVLWLRSAEQADIQAGKATSAMFVSRSLTQIAQPFILSALLAGADSFAVIVIGTLCLLCAGLFFLLTRRTSLSEA